MAYVVQKKRAHGTNARVLIRAALVVALGTLLSVAISCSSSPAPSGETVASTSSALTGCGDVSLWTTVAGAPASQSLIVPKVAGAIIPETVAISNWGGFYPGISVTATLAVGTTTCTYAATFWSGWGDATFQSCSDGAVPGSVRQGANVTLSVSSSPVYYGTDATVTVGKSPDDGNSCSVDSCVNGVVDHANAPAGTSCDPNNDVCDGTQVCGSSGECNSAIIPPPPLWTDGDPCTVDNCTASTGMTHVYNAQLCPLNPNLPPNSGSDPTLPRDFSKSVEFIYTAGNPPAQHLPNGVPLAPGTITPARATVIRGTVNDSNGPLLNATVTILNHPEYGSTLTRSDGRFEMVVNGGEAFTVDYAMSTYLPVQRRVETRWHDWSIVDDAILLPEGSVLTDTVPVNDAAYHYVRGPKTNADGDPERTPVLIIPDHTTVNGWAPAGGAPFSFRMKEFTVGANGPAAMPGSLPPQSAYTYAIDLKIDGAPSPTTFNHQVIFYVDNFNNTSLDPSGQEVPSGYYDRTTGTWKGEETGRVVKVINVVNNAAVLSFDGTTPVADGGPEGITLAEREQLYQAYPSINGKSFWRVRLAHFSTEDLNWSAPPPQAEFPGGEGPMSSVPLEGPTCHSGSIIECESGVLGESIPLTGVPFGLHYRSETQRGFKTQIKVPYAGNADPVDLTNFLGAEVEVKIMGKRYFFPIDYVQNGFKNGFVTVDWDRTDGNNQPVSGTVSANVRVAWLYKAQNGRTPTFGAAGAAVITGNRGARVIRMNRYFNIPVGAFDASGQSLGGWTVGLQHVLDPEHGMLWRGDGSKVDLHAMPGTVWTETSTIANCSYRQVAVGPDGRKFVWTRSALHEVINGTLVPLSIPNGTNDDSGYSGGNDSGTADGTYLANVQFGRNNGWDRQGMSAGIIPLDGDQFLLGINFRIWKVGPAPNRAVTLIAGNRTATGYTSTSDGQLALGAGLPSKLGSLARGPDGSLYYVDYSTIPSAPASRIRRILPNGKLETLIGGATEGTPDASCWRPTPPTPDPACTAKDWPIGMLGNSALTVDPAGNVYFTSQMKLVDNDHGGNIWRITPGGRLFLHAGLAGNIPAGPTYREGARATETSLTFTANYAANPSALAWRDGALYYVETNTGQIRVVDPEGRTRVIAGNGTSAYTEGGPARTQGIIPAFGLAAGPDGNLYFTRNVANGSGGAFDGYFHRLELGNLRRKSNGDYLVPSGSEVYVFDSKGRHQETLSSARGRSIWQFHYDSLGRLDKVTDAQALLGHHDTILTYSSGKVTIMSPWGKINDVFFDGSGYVSSVSEPETSYTLTHSNVGLLLSFNQAGGSNHTFTYEPNGRLKNDKDGLAYSAGTSLLRTDGLTSYTSSLTTAESRTTTHIIDLTRDVVDLNGARVELRRHIDPNNLETKDARYADGTQVVTLPDGSTIKTQTTADPRFGVSAAYVSSSELKTGSPVKTVTATQTIDNVSTNPASDPLGLTTSTTTRKVNNVTRSITDFTVSGNEAIVETRTPLGRKSRVVLDEKDRVKRIEPQGSIPGVGGSITPLPISITYDNDGNVETVTQGTRTTTYAYGSSTGFVSSVAGPFGTTSFTYEREDGLPLDTTLPGGRTLTSLWDSHGVLKSLFVPRSAGTWNQHGFGIDSLDRVSSYNPPSAGFSPKDTIYAYDKESAIKSVTQPTDLVSVARDLGGRPITVSFTDPTGQGSRTIETVYSGEKVASVTSKLNGWADATLTYGYDGMLLKTEQYDNVFAATIYHDYDSLLRPWKRSLGAQNLANPHTSNPTTATNTYDSDGVLSNVNLGGINYAITRNTVGNAVLQSTSAGAVTDSYQYDAYGALVHYEVKLAGVPVYDVSYDRTGSNTGRVNTKTEIIDGIYGGSGCKTAFGYDAKNFLASSTKSQVCSGSAAYDYDLAGNRTVSGWQYDAQDRLTTDGGWTYKYNNDGALTALASPSWYDYYTWSNDAFGQIRRVVYTYGPTFNYRYDGLGREVLKSDGNNARIKGYLWDGGHIVGEVNAAGTVIAHYVYVTRPNVPDFMVRYDGSAWQTYRLISDQAGSPKLLIRLTGSIGIVERYDWDDWGVALVTWPGMYHPFGFAGGLWDGDVGNYRFGARAYDAWKGRWWSKDPSGFGGGANFYVYSENDPVNLVDWSGLAPNQAYPTKDEAAAAALTDVLPASIGDGRERGGWVYRRPDGQFSYPEPVKGPEKIPGTLLHISPRSFTPIPTGATLVGMYHTHPGCEDYSMNDWLSRQDRKKAEEKRVSAYLGGPSGILIRWDPQGIRPAGYSSPLVPKIWVIGMVPGCTLCTAEPFPSWIDDPL